MRRRSVQSAAAVSFIGLVLTTGGCDPAPEAAPSPSLRVAIDLWPGYYPLIIADENGYFEEEGVALSISMPEDTDRMMADFAAHTYDIVAVALGDVIGAAALDPGIRVFLVSDQSDGGDAMVGQTPLSDPQAIRGKRIGTNLGGFGELFISRWLEQQGMSTADVTLVNVESAQVPAMVASGEIDGGHCWEPYVSQALDAGAHLWFSSHDTPGLIPDVLAVHSSVVNERNEELKGFLRAWFRAVEWWQAHPDEGNALVERRLKQPEGSISLKGIRLMTLEANRNAFAPDESTMSLHHVTNLYVDFFIKKGSLSRRVDPGELLEPSLLQ